MKSGIEDGISCLSLHREEFRIFCQMYITLHDAFIWGLELLILNEKLSFCFISGNLSSFELTQLLLVSNIISGKICALPYDTYTAQSSVSIPSLFSFAFHSVLFGCS